MKKLLLLSLLVGNVLVAAAQSKGYDDKDTISLPQKDIAAPKLTTKDRLHFGVSMGTSISFSRGQDAIMAHFMAPTLSYQVTDKFKLSGGVALQYNSLNNPWTYGNAENGSTVLLLRPKMQSTLFVRGEYALNPKLTLTGSMFANTASLNVPGLNPQSYNLNTYGASGGFWYKINDKASFGAEVQIIRSNNPYQRYGGGGFGMGNGFGGGFGTGMQDPFSPIGTW